jgi:lipopolysaccharide export system permease protein
VRILDRYVIRQLLMPFGIGLLVFTFLFIIPEFMRYAEDYIAKGAPMQVVAEVFVALLPMALGLTIPMSLLMALLVAFGRLSSDREFVAFQACGISMRRLLRPVGLVSVLCFGATLYVLLVSVPASNQRFREITFKIIASLAEGEVKPRVFYERFPNIDLYVREIPPTGGWNGVFMSDNRSGDGSTIYIARRGRVVIDRSKKSVEMVLDEGTRHTADPAGNPYDVQSFDRVVVNLSPENVFPSGGPPKGDREMSISELRARADEIRAQGQFPHNQLFEIHKKFSIPAACLVFGLIGLALGATNRRDGKLASFVIGVAIVFVYYILLWLGQSLTKGTHARAMARGVAPRYRSRDRGYRPPQVARPCRRSPDARAASRVRAEAGHGDDDWTQPFSSCRSARWIATSHSPTCVCGDFRRSRCAVCFTSRPSPS